MYRTGRVLVWLCASLLLILALLTTLLRILLPNLNVYQSDISNWLQKSSGVDLRFANVEGEFSYLTPSLKLQNVVFSSSEKLPLTANVETVKLRFDVWRSVMQKQLVIEDVELDGLDIDARALPIAQRLSHDESDDIDIDAQNTINRLDNIILKQLGQFSLKNAHIHFLSSKSELKTLDVDHLTWINEKAHHRFSGVVSVQNEGVSSVQVGADFEAQNSFRQASGSLYLSARDIEINNWLPKAIKSRFGINDGHLSSQVWFDFKNSRLSHLWADLSGSSIELGEDSETAQALNVEHGVLELSASDSKYVAALTQTQLTLQGKPFEPIDFRVVFDGQSQQWLANLSKLALGDVTRFLATTNMASSTKQWVNSLSPSGGLNDIRVSGTDKGVTRYSANLEKIGIKQTGLLPELHHLDANVAGTPNAAVIHTFLQNDTLPYGDVFQAALNIDEAKSRIVWQKLDNGWRLWSDDSQVQNHDLSAVGQFRLDMLPTGGFLSLYSEVDVTDAGQTWRYLPTRALGLPLTEYLSKAILGGEVSTAKLLWYGPLRDFPYTTHSGVFQAQVPLRSSTYNYFKGWPELKSMDIDLLFNNESLLMEASHAKLRDVDATYIKADIMRLHPDGVLRIDAKVQGQGQAVEHFMQQSPLTTSVGSALAHLQVRRKVSADLELDIPLNGKNTQAQGRVRFADNDLLVTDLSMQLSALTGELSFKNDLIDAKNLSANWLGQKIDVSFSGEQSSKNYHTDIYLSGDWSVSKLNKRLQNTWLEPLSGTSNWDTKVAVDIKPLGFDYQVHTQAQLENVTSRYPAPLDKSSSDPGLAELQAAGNQEKFTARLSVPNGKYQVEVNLDDGKPEIVASNWVIGRGNFKVSPIQGHTASFRGESVNLDDWISMLQTNSKDVSSTSLQTSSSLTLPMPEVLELNADNVELAGLTWHDVNFSARYSSTHWAMKLESQETNGQGSYIAPYDLTVSLDDLHLYIPALDKVTEVPPYVDTSEDDEIISDFDRAFYRSVPNLTLLINDFWLQGYKVGQVNMDFQRQGDTLQWKSLDITSGNNELKAQGRWTLTDTDSRTEIETTFKGDNNTDLMDRFGVTSGIQKAPFSIRTKLDWQGAPWSMRLNTLSGTINTKLGQGMISDAGGAAKLLGLFSLDSIIRKMKLDFSDVFDKGLAFESIKGDGTLKNGVFTTNNLIMDSVAGDMKIKGKVDLNSRQIDSGVTFVPDLTSGIPVLSAFAVTPMTALYVLAITTVISPVIDVFTEVHYDISGSIDDPIVKERSRKIGEFQMPEDY